MSDQDIKPEQETDQDLSADQLDNVSGGVVPVPLVTPPTLSSVPAGGSSGDPLNPGVIHPHPEDPPVRPVPHNHPTTT